MNGGERGGKLEKLIEQSKLCWNITSRSQNIWLSMTYGFFALLLQYQVSPIILTHAEQRHNAPAFQQVEEERWLSPTHAVSPVATLYWGVMETLSQTGCGWNTLKTLWTQLWLLTSISSLKAAEVSLFYSWSSIDNNSCCLATGLPF